MLLVSVYAIQQVIIQYNYFFIQYSMLLLYKITSYYYTIQQVVIIQYNMLLLHNTTSYYKIQQVVNYSIKSC